MRASIILSVCTLVLVPALAAADDPPLPFEVTITDTEIIVPVGARIPLRFAYTNTTDSPGGMLADHIGFPSIPNLRVVDSSGDDVSRVPAHVGGPPRPPRGADFYKYGPRESIMFEFPLERIFDLSEPGDYRVEFFYRAESEVVLDTAEIRILPIVHVESKKFKGYCEHPTTGPLAEAGALAVECTFLAVPFESKTKDHELLLTVLGCVFGADRTRGEHVLHMRAPAGTELVRAEIGCDFRLWTLLKYGSEQTLVVWHLRDGTTTTLVPWTKMEIEFGTMTARRGSDVLKVVIAGLASEAKFTSRSLQ